MQCPVMSCVCVLTSRHLLHVLLVPMLRGGALIRAARVECTQHGHLTPPAAAIAGRLLPGLLWAAPLSLLLASCPCTLHTLPG